MAVLAEAPVKLSQIDRIIRNTKRARLLPARKPTLLINFLKTEHPIAYYLVFPKILDETWYEWEPETLWTSLERSYDIVPTEKQKNIIHSVKSMFFEPYKRDWEAFEKVSLAADGVTPNFDVVEDIDPFQIVKSVIQGMVVLLNKKPGFSEEVRRYCSVRFVTHEYMAAPAILSDVQQYIDEISDRSDLSTLAISASPSKDYGETELGVQVAKLRALNDYAKELLDEYEKITGEVIYFLR